MWMSSHGSPEIPTCVEKCTKIRYATMAQLSPALGLAVQAGGSLSPQQVADYEHYLKHKRYAQRTC